jgi:cell division protein FtsQ
VTATEQSSRTARSPGRPRGPRPTRRLRSARLKITLAVAGGAALLGGAAWALFGSSLFAVRSVQLSGLGPISREQVLAAARITIGTPLITVNTNAIARRVDRLTLVQSAQVRRSWPDAIVIKTVPRSPVFAVRAGDRYDVMDSYGVILGHERKPGSGLVLLKAQVKFVAALRGNVGVRAAGTVVRRLPAWLRRRLAAVRTQGAVVILILRPRITVVWGTAAWETEKAESLAVLLPTKATYYDVSDPQSAVTGGH